MSRWSLFVVLLVGCHGSPRPAAPTTSAVTGHVTVAPGVAATRGKLFVTWMTVEEKHTLDTERLPLLVVQDMISRGTVVGEVDAAHGAAFTVHPGRGRIVLSAAVDVGHAGVVSLFGVGGALHGVSAPFEATDAAFTAPPITLTAAAPPHKELCQGPGLTLERLDAPEVAGTVGNPTSRRVCVRVPRDYADHPARHYPVIFGLPGLSGTDESLIAHGDVSSDAAIVVFVDTSTKTGSTYLVDSPITGAWDTFFAKHLVPYIDAHYRTLPTRSARGLMGHSTGGFNAMSYGLRHPELFGAIGSSSPDGLDFTVWLHRPLPRWMVGWQRVERELAGPGQFVSYSADWSPTARGYDWLFDDSGAIVDAVLQRWLPNTPATWLRDPQRVAALKPFSDHIYLTVGDADEFGLHDPTVAFSHELDAAGIRNQLVLTHGGHLTHLDEQTKATVQFCTSHLDAAR